MRILALSDLHGAYDQAEKILARESAYDMILICGDITTRGSSMEVDRTIKRFQTYGKPLLSIAGNMDSREIDDVLVQAGCSLHSKGIILENIGFFGVSAGPFSPLHTPYEISEDEIRQHAEAGWNTVKDARWKVFVPHAPPQNTNLDRLASGKHVGSTAVRNFIETYHPDVVVCGHIHEARGLDSFGPTQMMNCGTAAAGYYGVIDIDTTITLENRE